LSEIYELDIFMDGLAALYIFINGLMVCIVYIHRWAYYTCISENGLMFGNIYPQIGSLLYISMNGLVVMIIYPQRGSLFCV
jgi:hypothetical protein